MKRYVAIALISTFVKAGKYQLSHNLQCPMGYDLVGKKCEKNIMVPGALTCLVGEMRLGSCVTTTGTIVQCPLGTVSQGDTCVVKNSISALPHCPADYYQEGQNCVLKKHLDIVDHCVIGKPDGRGNCVMMDKTSKIRRETCPDGYYSEANSCVKITEYDCSPNEVPVIMPQLVETVSVAQPVYLSQSHGSAHGTHRMLGSKKSTSYVPLRTAPVPVVQQTIVEAPLVPPTSVSVIQQTCRRKDYVNLISESQCPSGYAEDGEFCTSISIVNASKVCSNGNSIDSCFSVEVTPLKFSCTDGILNGQDCILTSFVEKEVVCPAGTYMENNECVHITSPQMICPAGTFSDGIQCIGKELSEPIGTIETPCVGKECFSNY